MDISILTAVLILVTMYYAWQTKKLNDYSRLNIKRERLFKEVDNLIKPLYDVLTQMITPTAIGFSQIVRSYYFENQYKFIANIMANKYLGPKPLREAIDNYLHLLIEPGEGSKEAISNLFSATKTRYDEIQSELDLIDKELENKQLWQFWK